MAEQLGAGDVVATLVDSLPRAPRLTDVVDGVGRLVGKPTRVVDVDGPSWGPLTALVSQFEHENLVLVPAGAPALYRMHCVLHELGHLANGDTGAPTTSSIAAFASGGHVCRRALDGETGLVSISDDDEHFAERFAYELATVLLGGASGADERAYG
ncbi:MULTISPECIES: hypothetical protein [unclassified Curtobacterium]|uniref:hypothetical protein n=1 Tax=unclassified Curtobacterium TaxID=257496 RepID=UPI0008DDA581|nr:MULTISPECIES: hypothetical protein [unclassified Curtobacterium]OIH97542.1 hypothetical protein BIU92_15275 [Curtobacterium sp. MCBA15_003]OII10954.1 hypothetical protein BIU97_08740 [Curtobacterium sp. MCBA15_009]OII29217.1 hypothetical protein BIU94_12330 [Curtobacterium sp. MMLR14_006]